MSRVFSLFGDRTVVENIELCTGIKRQDRSATQERPDWILERVNLLGVERERGSRAFPLDCRCGWPWGVPSCTGPGCSSSMSRHRQSIPWGAGGLDVTLWILNMNLFQAPFKGTRPSSQRIPAPRRLHDGDRAGGVGSGAHPGGRDPDHVHRHGRPGGAVLGRFRPPHVLERQRPGGGAHWS